MGDRAAARGWNRAGHCGRPHSSGLRHPGRQDGDSRSRVGLQPSGLHPGASCPRGQRSRMIAIIFAGPSLPPSAAPSAAGLEWRPPVRQGDLYRAALSSPALIGVIDGYFELVPTVWHKEILWAMANGIHIYGAASIGALRAAELADFGMQGMGHIYRQYRTGALMDDEEVAVLHGPKEVDYVPVTEATVNIRATIDRALELGVVAPAVAAALL